MIRSGLSEALRWLELIQRVIHSGVRVAKAFLSCLTVYQSLVYLAL